MPSVPVVGLGSCRLCFCGGHPCALGPSRRGESLRVNKGHDNANILSDLSLIKVPKKRVQFAETGQWDVLLSEYLRDRREEEERETLRVEADSCTAPR